jgi:hypothetical protein
MLGSLIQLLFLLLIIGVVWWAITQLLPLIPLPHPLGTIVHVILVVILALILIYFLAAIFGVALPSLR